MQNAKMWYKSRSIWINLIMMTIWILSLLSGMLNNPEYVLILGLVTGTLNLILRYLTGQPISFQQIEEVAQDAAKAIPAQSKEPNNIPGKGGGD